MSVADQVGSDGHRIGLAGQPFEFESERNGEQAIDDRMLPALAPALRARTPTPPTYRQAGQATPRARILPQEVGNTWEPKTPIHA